MTREGITRTLAMLAAAYPNWRMTDATVAVWADKLKDFDDSDVDSAADLWIVNSSKAPVVADIHKIACEEARKRHEAAADRAGLPSPESTPATRAQVKKMLAVTRGLLAEWEKNKGRHWHGGPEPCPVCGGMKSNVRHSIEVPAERDEVDA